jgi:hypothetical protein
MPLDRRQFLGTTASAAAGAALAWNAAARADEAPSQRIVLGVMGVNGRGAGLVRGFATLPGVEVAYVCDVDDTATEKCAALLSKETERTPQSVRDFEHRLWQGGAGPRAPGLHAMARPRPGARIYR